MSKKRVLIVYRSYFPSLSHLGPATAIRNLAAGMAGDYHFHILTLNHEFATGATLFDDDIHRTMNGNAIIEYVPKGLGGWRILMKRLREGFDVVDIQCAFDPLLAIPALAMCRLGLAKHSRVFHTPHGIFMDVIMSANAAKKRLYCRVADVFGLYKMVTHLAGSPSEEADIRRRHAAAQHVRMVSQFVAPPSQAFVARSKQPRILRIAMVGRITEQKNVLFALDVMRRLTVPSSLDLFGEVGDDDYARACREAVAIGTRRCNVTFKGTIAKAALFEQLQDYDVLLHPTLGENFGHAIVEALALGVPVLISDKSPWTDVADAGAGWALPLSNPAAFAAKLEAIYAMGAEWSALSEGAAAYARATFDNARTADRYRAAYG